MSTLKALSDYLTPDQAAAFERRASRVEHAFTTDPVLCVACGVRFLDYVAVAAETRPDCVPDLRCRREGGKSACAAIARLDEMLDDRPGAAVPTSA